jgi:hypothetical protein
VPGQRRRTPGSLYPLESGGVQSGLGTLGPFITKIMRVARGIQQYLRLRPGAGVSPSAQERDPAESPGSRMIEEVSCLVVHRTK